MKKIIYGFAALSVALASVACQPENKDPQDPPVVEDTLNLSSAQLKSTAAGGEQTITFTTTAAWELKSSADWVSVDPSKGEAGEVSVKVTIAANETYEDREATLTLAAGNMTATWKVLQSYALVFGASSEINISAAAQTIAITVTANQGFQAVADVEWISVVATKAAPVEKAVNLEVKANGSIEPRTGVVTVTAADGSAVAYTINQAASESALVPESFVYIGSYNDPYDNENYTVNSFKQYYVSFLSSKGSVAVAFTPASEDTIAGEYEVDAAASFEKGTFSVKPIDNYTPYYTKLVEGNNEINIVDGLVEIAQEGENYEFIIGLMDEHELIYTFTYSGALPEMTVSPVGAEVAVSFAGDYATYFANGAQLYSVNMYTSAAPEGCDHYAYYLNFDVVAPKESTPNALPLGTYSFNEEYDVLDLPYRNGINNYTVGTFHGFSGYSDWNQANYEENQKHWEAEDWEWEDLVYYYNLECLGGDVTISAGSVEGTYNFEYNLSLRTSLFVDYDYETWEAIYEYGEPFDYKVTLENIAVNITDNHQAPTPDEDFVFTYSYPNANYQGYWLGDSYANGGNVYILYYGSINGAYTVYFPLQASAPYTFEKNYANRYCSNPLADATFNWALTSDLAVDAEGKPTNIIPNIKTNSRKVVTNGYTGTSAIINGGSVALENGNIVFNLVATTTDGSKTFSYTGGFATTCDFLQDWSAANRQTYVAWATVE